LMLGQPPGWGGWRLPFPKVRFRSKLDRRLLGARAGFKPLPLLRYLRGSVRLLARPGGAGLVGGGGFIGGRLPGDAFTDELSLVRQAQAGDLHAFERLYRENERKVYGLCCRMSADPSLAEDLTQEVFVRAWRKLGSFRGESAFSSWLYPLTVNVVLS